jgi:hypothetical protein
VQLLASQEARCSVQLFGFIIIVITIITIVMHIFLSLLLIVCYKGTLE